MADVGFYHLTRTGALEALPVLLGKTLDAGKRAVVRCGAPRQTTDLDEALWKISDPVWLPHAATGGKYPERQPIWITAGDDVPNAARFLFLIGVPKAPPLEPFDRVFDLFDGRDEEAVAAARLRWAALKQAGHDLAYWRQDAKGWTRAR